MYTHCFQTSLHGNTRDICCCGFAFFVFLFIRNAQFFFISIERLVPWPWDWSLLGVTFFYYIVTYYFILSGTHKFKILDPPLRSLPHLWDSDIDCVHSSFLIRLHLIKILWIYVHWKCLSFFIGIECLENYWW